ncbi:MAG: hypothetical protein IK135_02595 [Bacteroidales bacterium]|nr:hypothetical protein [Bacteroidales bacterium]
MNHKELMIGDWILYTTKAWKVIDLMSCGSHYPMTIGKDSFERCREDGVIFLDEKDIATALPLLISEQMFSANGFRRHDDPNGDFAYLLDVEEHELTAYIYDIPNVWRFQIQRGPEASVSIKARYVHQLQHAMRLMGLHDMANNFKIQEVSDQ